MHARPASRWIGPVAAFALAVVVALATLRLAPTRAADDPPGKAHILPVLSTSDAVGKVTPCGCHTPKGGLARLASVIDSTRIKYGDVVVVEAGDWAPEDEAQQHYEMNFDFQMSARDLMGFDAVGIGEREFNFGLDKLEQAVAAARTPYISSNLVDKKTGKPVFKTYVVVKKLGLKVGIFSLLGPKIDLPASVGEKVSVGDPIAAATNMVDELRHKQGCDVVIALTHLGRIEGEDLAAQVPGIDVVILAHHPGFVAQGRRVKDAVTVASGEQAQNVGVTRVTFEGKKVTDLASETIILMPEVGERGDMAKLVKDADDQRNAVLARESKESEGTNPGLKPGADQYVGAETCGSCHAAQYQQWMTTQHSHAFSTLQRTQKDATPECVQCHVVGYRRASGYMNAQVTGKLQNVGCEACHGYGTRHDAMIANHGAVAESVCLSCHQSSNDPGWNYAAKKPRISH